MKRATEDIYINGIVLAYRKGDPVPDSAVKNLKIEDKVAGGDSKAVAEAASERRAESKK